MRTAETSSMMPKTPEMGVTGEPKHVVIVAAPGTSAIEIAGPAEAFRMTGEKLREAGRRVAVGYQIHVLSVTDNPMIETSAGFSVMAHANYRGYGGPIDTLLCVGGLEP
jgi:transcriptional regulator GlxA family with amidase domain